MLPSISLFIKGLILGVCAVTPGISIGTMALVLGLYERGIVAFTRFFSLQVWRNKKDLFSLISFLAPLVLGIGFAMFFASRIFLWVFDSYSAIIKLFFIGIILASIPHFFQKHLRAHFSASSLLYIIAGYVVILLLGNSTSGVAESSVLLTASVGEFFRCLLFSSIAAVAGLLPGISGSYLLLVLGYYPSYLAILSSANIVLLISLLLGLAIGTFCAAHIVKKLFTSLPKVSYAVVFGMILASLQKVFPLQEILSGELSSIVLASIAGLAFFFGIGIFVLSTRL